MTPDAEEVELIVLSVVRRYKGVCWSGDRQEMIQDAHLAVVEAQRSFDPKVGVPFKDYAKRAVAFALKRKLWASSFAAYVPERERREAATLGSGRGISTSKWEESPASGGGVSGAGRGGCQAVPKSLQALFDPPTLLERRRWKQRVARRLFEVLVPVMGDEVALVIPVLTGEETPEAVASRAGITHKRVHKLTCRARFLLRGDRELRELWKEGDL